MGRRVREKLEKAKMGEDHHILEEEEANWARTTGIEIGHVKTEPFIICRF